MVPRSDSPKADPGKPDPKHDPRHEPKHEPRPPRPELSPRQRQILKLLQAGMVNKEVARELDIGLGTVKQHIVALFKKLNVSNRAMAVAHGIEMLHEEEGGNHANSTSSNNRSSDQWLNASGLLEGRPCVVLSIALPEDASQTAVRLMYGNLADVAAANDAVFVARKGNAGDVIFGVQRVTEYDVAVALQTACGIYADLLEWDRLTAAKLRGCLTAGLAFASMKRFGGWTGEAIASTAISFAREMLAATAPGDVAFDRVTHDLIEVFGIGRPRVVAPVMSFEQLKTLQWTGSRRRYPLVGRDTELTLLDVALKGVVRGQGMMMHLEGEMGMGKSRLCEEFLTHWQAQGGVTSFFRCSPPVLGSHFHDIASGASCSAADIAAVLQGATTAAPELIIVDDIHLLDADQQPVLAAAAAEAVAAGKLVIFSGRRVGGGDRSTAFETIRLRRLSNKDVETLVRSSLAKSAAGGRAKKVTDISAVAAGVPLFAVELARQLDTAPLDTPPLEPHAVAFPILVAINARLDSLQLDRRLLKAVARAAGKANLDALAVALGEAPAGVKQQAERATQAGVLSLAADGSFAFTHPLLQRAIFGMVAE